MKIRWPALRLPPINLWNAPHQPALEDTMTEAAERDEVQDQLCSRIDDLEMEKEALAAQLDKAEEERDAYQDMAHGMSSDLTTVGEERDALAAHVERLSDSAKRFYNATVGETGVEVVSPIKRLVDEVNEATEELRESVEAAPTTSLARRDAEKRIEGAMAIRHLTQGDDWEDDDLRVVIVDYVAELRRQAEEADQ